MTRLDLCASFEDFRSAARKRLPRILFDYIDGGSYSETTLQRNVDDFRHIELYPRIMKDVADISQEISLFGQTLSMPALLAPIGFAGMYARRGETQAARAAQAAGIPFCLSTVGICSIEEVAAATGKPPWFQLYMIKDREWMRRLLERATAAGCPVLVLTADLQTPGARYRDIRSGMMRRPSTIDRIARGSEGMRKTGWTWDLYMRGRPHTFGNLDGVLPATASFDEAWKWIGANFDPTVTWDDVGFIRRHWDGPILLKGVMTSADARAALTAGIDGLVVSNHGGRQLDGAPSSISVLPRIVDVAAAKIPVLFDSGIRSGLDILKAIRSGASACMLGRPWAFALAAGGEAGVSRVLEILRDELATAQRLTATLDLSDANG